MNPPGSSCEIAPPTAPGPAGSRVLRLGPDFRWQGVPVAAYKDSEGPWCGIARMLLVGGAGERVGFHVRYFEIAPGGFSSFERHAHEHAVVVLRGRGEVRLGDVTHALGFGDVVYVSPDEPHQFRNPTEEPFGFLCVVDAERDRPVLV